MDIIITPRQLSGSITAIASKSQAHRLLICAAFADRPTHLRCAETNEDIEATVDCLNAMGAKISRVDDGYLVTGISQLPVRASLPCRESGSTLRFLLPIVGALGIDATFTLEGRLSKRPLSPLWEELERNGVTLTRPSENTVRSTGRLTPGTYTIDGGVSSQFISGLLFATALLPGDSRIVVTGKLESAPYVGMTQSALQAFGVDSQDYCVCGTYPFRSPGSLDVEGDWSNAAFFLAAGAMGQPLTVTGLSQASAQGDRMVIQVLRQLQQRCTVSAAQIPDLIPILSVVAAANKGAVFTDIARLRLKESDRVASTAAMLQALGCEVKISNEEMEVFPAPFQSATINSAGDHRIAMAAAIAATKASGPVTILGAQCVRKSYPRFWEDYRAAGGQYEQYIR